MGEIQLIKNFEIREALLEKYLSQYKRSKSSFGKKLYSLKCGIKLFAWKLHDRLFRSEWLTLSWVEWDSKEELEQAMQQKFENRTWVSNCEQKITEYVFKMEWLLGLWSPEKVDIEVTSIGTKSNCVQVIAELLELDCEKDKAVIEEMLVSAPVVFMENVPIRKAEKIKQTLEGYCGAEVTLLPKGECIDSESTETYIL